MTSDILEEAAELYNLMFVVHYDENAADTYTRLRELGLLYSVWYQYGEKDMETIVNGDLFCSAQQFFPIFTVFLPGPECSDTFRHLTHQTVHQARKEQNYHTILWELLGDNNLIDSIISNDTCFAYFDMNGNLCDGSRQIKSDYHNLFQSSLADIFVSACPKKGNVF